MENSNQIQDTVKSLFSNSAELYSSNESKVRRVLEKELSEKPMATLEALQDQLKEILFISRKTEKEKRRN